MCSTVYSSGATLQEECGDSGQGAEGVYQVVASDWSILGQRLDKL